MYIFLALVTTPQAFWYWQDIVLFDTLDGRELVSYQCVVRRSDWEPLRSLEFEFLLVLLGLNSEVSLQYSFA